MAIPAAERRGDATIGSTHRKVRTSRAGDTGYVCWSTRERERERDERERAPEQRGARPGRYHGQAVRPPHERGRVSRPRCTAARLRALPSAPYAHHSGLRRAAHGTQQSRRPERQRRRGHVRPWTDACAGAPDPEDGAPRGARTSARAGHKSLVDPGSAVTPRSFLGLLYERAARPLRVDCPKLWGRYFGEENVSCVRDDLAPVPSAPDGPVARRDSRRRSGHVRWAGAVSCRRGHCAGGSCLHWTVVLPASLDGRSPRCAHLWSECAAAEYQPQPRSAARDTHKPPAEPRELQGRSPHTMPHLLPQYFTCCTYRSSCTPGGALAL